MANGNNVAMVGNCTRDPELKYTASGQANTKFGLAVSRRWMDKKTDEWQEETSFFNVVLWGQMAENVAESVSKGSRVMVIGRIDVRNYEDKEGKARVSVDLVADEIGPSLRWATAQISRTERSDNGGGGSNGASAPQAAPKAPQAQAPVYSEDPF